MRHTTNLTSLPLTGLLKLKEQIAHELEYRFERRRALLFTDVVGSTPYVAAHGDIAGRDLLQRHRDIVRRALTNTDARIIDTAGDGAFCMAKNAAEAVRVLVQLHRSLLSENRHFASEHRLSVRSGIHVGRVLVEGDLVTGEAVHAAARVTATADADEIRLTQAVFDDLHCDRRLLCARLGPQQLKGVNKPVDIFLLDWRDARRFPTAIEVLETGERHGIPCQNRVTLGRLDMHASRKANDIVISHPNEGLTRHISRWHAELEMTDEGYLLRSLSRAPTFVDSQPLKRGQQASVRPGSIVELGKVLTLRLFVPSSEGESTVMSQG